MYTSLLPSRSDRNAIRAAGAVDRLRVIGIGGLRQVHRRPARLVHHVDLAVPVPPRCERHLCAPGPDRRQEVLRRVAREIDQTGAIHQDRADLQVAGSRLEHDPRAVRRDQRPRVVVRAARQLDQARAVQVYPVDRLQSRRRRGHRGKHHPRVIRRDGRAGLGPIGQDNGARAVGVHHIDAVVVRLTVAVGAEDHLGCRVGRGAARTHCQRARHPAQQHPADPFHGLTPSSSGL